MDEKYYCAGCFGKGDQSVIPSRLIHNWDARPRDVCKSNMVFIESIRDEAILDIGQINPELYAQSHALNAVKVLACFFSCMNNLIIFQTSWCCLKKRIYEKFSLFLFLYLNVGAYKLRSVGAFDNPESKLIYYAEFFSFWERNYRCQYCTCSHVGSQLLKILKIAFGPKIIFTKTSTYIQSQYIFFWSDVKNYFVIFFPRV